MIPLNDETRFILGRPCFTVIPMVQVLRIMGHEIPHKAEDEQAHAIHWMLTLYESHGAGWRDEANRILREAKARFEAKRSAEGKSEAQ
jgi:hypothetical protein